MKNLLNIFEWSIWEHTTLITIILFLSMILPYFVKIFTPLKKNRMTLFSKKNSQPFAFVGIGAMLSICFIDFIPELFEAGNNLSILIFLAVLIIYAITHLKHFFGHIFESNHKTNSNAHIHAKYQASDSSHQFCSTHLDQIECRTHVHDTEVPSTKSQHDLHHNHNAHHGHEFPHAERSYFLFLMSMTIHCFSSGLLLGSSTQFSIHSEAEHFEHSVFLALITHKAFEGFLVAAIFEQANLQKIKKYSGLFLYLLSFPFGVFAAQYLSTLADTNIIATILSSIAGASLAGCLIFDFLLPNFTHLKKVKIDIAWLFLGAVIAHFIIEQTHHH